MKTHFTMFAAFLSLLPIGIAGCKVRSELVVGMSTDLTARNQLDKLTFSALKNGVDTVDYSWDLTDIPDGNYELPGSIGLYTDDGSEPRVDLVVKGYLNGQMVVERSSVLSLLSGQTLFTRMGLVGDCNAIDGPICDDTEACVEGVCRTAAVDSHTLPGYFTHLSTWNACVSGPHWVNTSTGEPMPYHAGACDPGEYCREGTCYKSTGTPPATTPLWGAEATLVTSNLHGLWGTPDGADVFAVGDTGTIIHRSDANPTASSTWFTEASGTTDNLRGLWGTGLNDLFAVGHDGTILHRTNPAGWATDATLSGVSLAAVWGTAGSGGSDDVWAAGRDAQGNALVVHRVNGTWVTQSTAPGQLLRAIGGSSPFAVWVAGSQGTLIGGGVQSPFLAAAFTGQGPSVDLYGLWSDAATDVWAVGLGGLVLRYDGTAWTTVASPSPQDLLAVWGQSGHDLYAAGVDGYLLHYDGHQFATVNTGTTETLTAVWGTQAGDVFVAGYAGTLLHSTGVPFGADAGTAHDGGVVPDGGAVADGMVADFAVVDFAGGDALPSDLLPPGTPDLRPPVDLDAP